MRLHEYVEMNKKSRLVEADEELDLDFDDTEEEDYDDAEYGVENLSPEMQKLYDEIMYKLHNLYDPDIEYSEIAAKFVKKHLLTTEFKEALDTIIDGSAQADYDYVGAVVLKLDSGIILVGDSMTNGLDYHTDEVLNKMEKGMNGKVEIIGHYSDGVVRMDSSILPGTNLKVYQNQSDIAGQQTDILSGYAEFKNMDLLNQFLADSFGEICDITSKTAKFPAFYKVVKGTGNYPVAVIWNIIDSFSAN